jgi:hypothetical protein
MVSHILRRCLVSTGMIPLEAWSTYSIQRSSTCAGVIYDTAYFDPEVRNRVKQKLKKEQAGLESHQASNLWQKTFRYNYVVKLAEANIRTHHRENPGSAADASQAEAEAVKELVDVVSKGRSEENYRKHHRFWKLLHDVRVEGTNNEMEDAEARMLKDGLTHILLFRTKGFNRRFFNKTKSRSRQ